MSNQKAKRASRMLSRFAALSMAMSMVSVPSAAFAQDTQTDTTQTPAEVSVYPRPQAISYDSTEGMRLDGVVDIVVHGQTDEVTLNRLKTILNEQNITYKESENPSADHAQIILSDDPDHCSICSSTLDGVDHEQGYVLVSDNDANEKGTIVITGHDQDGVYNGVLTLGQMLDQKTEDGRIAEAVISDYPDILLRGAIEGFYGIPWTFENRKAIISDTAKFKMNTYIYAPKDDPYHKDQWKVLYPDEEAGHIRELVEEARSNNMEFIWCVHPGNGFDYTTDTDFNALIAKLEQLYSLGVRQFGISYDDLGGNNEGREQASLINRVSAYMKSEHSDVKNFLTVAKRYTDGWGSDWTSYLTPFLNALDNDVTLMWTGLNTGGVCGKNSFNGPASHCNYTKPLAFWFNYPVNDMAYGELLMGEMDSTLLDPEVSGLAGFYMNPMNQAQASKVALNQGADYSWNITDFQSHESWMRAIEEVAGEHAEAFARFADNTSYHSYEDVKVGESRELAPKVEAFNEALASKQGVREAAAALRAEFVQMQADVQELRTIDDELLLADITSHLDAYEELAKSGIAMMNGVFAALDFDVDGMKSGQESAVDHLNHADTFTVASMDRNGNMTTTLVSCGEHVLKPLLESAASKINAAYDAALSSTVEPWLISSDEQVSGTVSEDNGILSASISAEIPYGGYAGFSFGRLCKIESFEAELPKGTRLEYSPNGADWTTWNETAGNVDAVYVRLVNESDTPLTLTDYVIRAENLFKPITSMSASCSVHNGAYWADNTPAKAVDGDLKTKYWSDSPASDGDYFQVDLGRSVPIGSASIIFGANPKGVENGVDGFLSTKLQVSADGETWEECGTPVTTDDLISWSENSTTYAKAVLSGEGKTARYIRFTAVEAHEENWIQVYEVSVDQSGTTPDTMPSFGETNTEASVGSLCDGSLDTAFELADPQEGDYVIYNLSAITSVKDLVIVQSAISNGRLSVQNYDGTWEEVDILDAASNVTELSRRIKAVRIDFEAGSAAAIQEIVVRETDERIENTIMPPVMQKTDLDYSLLEDAIEKAGSLNQADFAKGWDACANALADGRQALDNAKSQDEVDKAADTLCDALLELRLAPGAERLGALPAEE